MLMIRLQRIGRTNDPSFRVIVTEKTASPKAGTHIELVGNYDARQKRVAFKEDRIKYWLSQGAQASGTVHNLLVNAKIIDEPKVNVLPSFKKKRGEGTPASPETKTETPKAEGQKKEDAAEQKEGKPEEPKEEQK